MEKDFEKRLRRIKAQLTKGQGVTGSVRVTRPYDSQEGGLKTEILGNLHKHVQQIKSMTGKFGSGSIVFPPVPGDQ